MRDLSLLSRSKKNEKTDKKGESEIERKRAGFNFINFCSGMSYERKRTGGTGRVRTCDQEIMSHLL